MLGPAVLNRVQPFINEFFPDPESENVLAVETGSIASSISGSRATVATVETAGDSIQEDQVQEQAAPAASESVEAVEDNETFEDASEDLETLLNMDI